MAGDGSEGIPAVFEEGNRSGNIMAVTQFDVLELNSSQSVLGERAARRKRLEDLLEFDGAMEREDHRCER